MKTMLMTFCMNPKNVSHFVVEISKIRDQRDLLKNIYAVMLFSEPIKTELHNNR